MPLLAVFGPSIQLWWTPVGTPSYGIELAVYTGPDGGRPSQRPDLHHRQGFHIEGPADHMEAET